MAFQNREQRASAAVVHTEKMQKEYGNYIQAVVSTTKLYDDNTFAHMQTEADKDKDTRIIVENMDSVGAVMKYGDTGTAVLNFASYKNPGGGYMNGSKAQEECLCQESFLYNVLREFQTEYYDWNLEHRNNTLYLNRGLFSPDVWFFREDKHVACGVITCAAPNKSAAQKFRNVTEKENTEALRSRIRFVLDIAKHNHVRTLILGAYGCGVFGQDAAEVAGIFKEYLTTTYKCFETVVFAVPSGRDANYDKFAKVFA